MAKIKQTVMQRSFTHMEVREDFLEGDDLDLRKSSLKGGRNMRALASRAGEARSGSFLVRTMGTASSIKEIRPAAGLRFGLIPNDESMQIIDETGGIVHEDLSPPWTSAASLYVNPFRDKIIIGDETGINTLAYAAESGTWSLDPFAFDETVGGELAQPYWAYEQDVTIQPNTLSGEVTVTASRNVWKNGHVGLRIRYGLREIEITERVNNKIVKGTVINQLPPSFIVTVDDTTVYRVGEVVVGADTNYQGLIVAIDGSDLHLVTTDFFEGPDVGEELSGGSGTSEVSAVASPAEPFASPIWDEPLMSDLRGWPRSASRVSGRIVFLDFPLIPDLIVLSSSRSIMDFAVGAGDDDAIVRQVGDGAPRWLHAMNMGDLLLFSDAGVYFVPARENGVISPSTFNAVLVDETGASTIPPVRIDDGVVFVDQSGEGVSACLLDGNVYLKWSVKSLTTFHDHQIKTPTGLCGPALGSGSSEKYMFVINADGTVAAVSWRGNIRDEQVGFAPWDTQGSYVSIAPIFDQYWQIVDRTVDGDTVRFLERQSADAFVDCAVSSTITSDEQYLMVNGDTLMVNGEPLVVIPPTASHLLGETVAYYANGWDLGDFVVPANGYVDPGVFVPGDFQIGLNFEAEMEVWPVEVIESPRIGTLQARVLEIVVSVQNTLTYSVSRNGKVRSIGGYKIGDDLDNPPALRTEVTRLPVLGRRDHPELIVAKRRPGPFRVLAIGQRVQA